MLCPRVISRSTFLAAAGQLPLSCPHRGGNEKFLSKMHTYLFTLQTQFVEMYFIVLFFSLTHHWVYIEISKLPRLVYAVQGQAPGSVG